MEYEWDENKAAANEAKHGVAFESIEDFDWDTALIEEDARFDYGEVRYRALGFVGHRLHTVIFTLRPPHIRLIGMRKSNKREQRDYDRKTQA